MYSQCIVCVCVCVCLGRSENSDRWQCVHTCVSERRPFVPINMCVVC